MSSPSACRGDLLGRGGGGATDLPRLGLPAESRWGGGGGAFSLPPPDEPGPPPRVGGGGGGTRGIVPVGTLCLYGRHRNETPTHKCTMYNLPLYKRVVQYHKMCFSEMGYSLGHTGCTATCTCTIYMYVYMYSAFEAKDQSGLTHTLTMYTSSLNHEISGQGKFIMLLTRGTCTLILVINLMCKYMYIIEV